VTALRGGDVDGVRYQLGQLCLGLRLRGTTSIAGARRAVDVTAPAITTAETTVQAAALRLRDREFPPSPGPACRRCEVRTVCRWAKA
jgi:predicted transcriptional regulator